MADDLAKRACAQFEAVSIAAFVCAARPVSQVMQEGSRLQTASGEMGDVLRDGAYRCLCCSGQFLDVVLG